MKKYIVTGGAGFIGSNIVEALVKRGEIVVVVDDFSTGSSENLKNMKDHIEIVNGSIENLELLKKTFQDVKCIFHEAAMRSIPRSIKDPIGSAQTNILGTLNVLVAARDCDVEKVVYASSSSSYGAQEGQEARVETLPAKPLSPYALSKYTAEEYCRIFHEIYGLTTVSLRYFNVFGPKQDPASEYAAVIPKFIAAALNHTEAEIHGDGTQSRDFTYIDNVVHANLLAGDAPNEKVAGQMFNIACNETVSLKTVWESIEAITKMEIKKKFTPTRAGDMPFSLADISKAKKTFGYTPIVPFKEGLKRTIEWYQKGVK